MPSINKYCNYNDFYIILITKDKIDIITSKEDNMNINKLIGYIKKNNSSYKIGNTIDNELGILIQWIREVFNYYKQNSKPEGVPFYEERLKDFNDVELYIKNLEEADINTLKENIQIIISTIYGNSIEKGDQDFDSKMNRKDACNLISIYFLIIKCNREQAFMIQKEDIYLVLNSAFRGNKFDDFKELLAIITNPKFLKTLNTNAFIGEKNIFLSKLSARFDEEKEPFDFDNIGSEVDNFLKGKVDGTAFIYENTSLIDSLRIRLVHNKNYNIEMMKKAKSVNQEIYEKFVNLSSSFEAYDNMDIHQMQKYLDFVDYIKNNKNMWKITGFQLIVIDLMARMNIETLSNNDLQMLANKLYDTNDTCKYNAILEETISFKPKLL